MTAVASLTRIGSTAATLAAHYDARADALGLAEAILPKDFNRLVETLAPSRLDFDKMKGARTEELLKIALALQRGR